jgi:hypothetical protein
MPSVFCASGKNSLELLIIPFKLLFRPVSSEHAVSSELDLARPCALLTACPYYNLLVRSRSAVIACFFEKNPPPSIRRWISGSPKKIHSACETYVEFAENSNLHVQFSIIMGH